jgi:uncharacterized membrane-anchored protein YhcB (DUF1043 family)
MWFLIGLVIGAVVGIFVYRNNQNKISKVADKVDTVVDKVKEVTKK